MLRPDMHTERARREFTRVVPCGVPGSPTRLHPAQRPTWATRSTRPPPWPPYRKRPTPPAFRRVEAVGSAGVEGRSGEFLAELAVAQRAGRERPVAPSVRTLRRGRPTRGRRPGAQAFSGQRGDGREQRSRAPPPVTAPPCAGAASSVSRVAIRSPAATAWSGECMPAGRPESMRVVPMALSDGSGVLVGACPDPDLLATRWKTFLDRPAGAGGPDEGVDVGSRGHDAPLAWSCVYLLR